MEIKVNTHFNTDQIISEIEYPDSDIIQSTTRQILDLQEEGIRQALIELGWTPPDED